MGRSLHLDIRRVLRAGAAIALVASAGTAAAATAIYSCTDATGKRITSDRLIVECAGREQRILNPDGSVRRIVPPTLTSEERAEQEAREQKAAAERAAVQDAIRRDRNLMIRYPNEQAHAKARNKALDELRSAVQSLEKRTAELTAERKPLLEEAEFYQGKALPSKLRGQLDANQAALDTQRLMLQNQTHEITRINTLYDVELARLKRLWGGAPPGSMGALPMVQEASASAPAAGVKGRAAQ
jgi:hypothetical protein